jgi:tol-pal system protein YbgF
MGSTAASSSFTDNPSEVTIVRRLTLAISIAALAGCSSITPTDDPVYLRLTDMEARLLRIERVVENESLIELAGEISALRNETQLLRGEIETMRFESENTATRQRDLYVDLDSRLQSLEQSQANLLAAARAPAAGSSASGAAAGALPGATGALAAGLPGGDQQAYTAAFEMIQSRRYPEAADAFRSFLGAYPESPMRDNAQYWLAETHYVRREFTIALGEFEKVLDEYPQSAKLPDALLKIGYCNYELRQWDAARQALQQVGRLYPDTTAARLAEQRLQRIAQETG